MLPCIKNGDIIPGEIPELRKSERWRNKVNQPLKYDHFAFYQVDYKLR